MSNQIDRHERKINKLINYINKYIKYDEEQYIKERNLHSKPNHEKKETGIKSWSNFVKNIIHNVENLDNDTSRNVKAVEKAGYIIQKKKFSKNRDIIPETIINKVNAMNKNKEDKRQ